VLKNICLTAGLGGSPYRGGSAAYYLGETVTENDAKGIAPYLMAFAEIIRA
jgi:unsaturated rhamnogalacturonyl hydrolase